MNSETTNYTPLMSLFSPTELPTLIEIEIGSIYLFLWLSAQVLLKAQAQACKIMQELFKLEVWIVHEHALSCTNV